MSHPMVRRLKAKFSLDNESEDFRLVFSVMGGWGGGGGGGG